MQIKIVAGSGNLRTLPVSRPIYTRYSQNARCPIFPNNRLINLYHRYDVSTRTPRKPIVARRRLTGSSANRWLRPLVVLSRFNAQHLTRHIVKACSSETAFAPVSPLPPNHIPRSLVYPNDTVQSSPIAAPTLLTTANAALPFAAAV